MAKIEPCKCAGGFCQITVRGCILGLINRRYQIRLRPAGSSTAKLLVRFKPKDSPVLHWRDDDRLQVDLGEVISLSPQIEQAGLVHVTFTYSGANPSLD
jgi:hypothetical protein